MTRKASFTIKGETRVPSNRSVPQSNLGKVKVGLLEAQGQAGRGGPGGKDGDTHSLLDRALDCRTRYIRPGDAHPVRDERPEKATYSREQLDG